MTQSPHVGLLHVMHRATCWQSFFAAWKLHNGDARKMINQARTFWYIMQHGKALHLAGICVSGAYTFVQSGYMCWSTLQHQVAALCKSILVCLIALMTGQGVHQMRVCW